MRDFRYWRDPLCMLACALYALNRVWLRRHVGGEFLTGYFNDLLLIPAALPFLLWLQRRIGVRVDDRQPRWGEIALHVLVWSVIAEAIMPHLAAHAVGDWRDVIAYAAGGAAAGAWWQWGVIV
jgi:hypothetical protein